MNFHTGYSMSFPVIFANKMDGNKFEVTGEVLGTAFGINDNIMITAGHVAANFQSIPEKCLIVGLSDGSYFKAAQVIDAEQLDNDIGLLKVEHYYPESKKWFHRFNWQRQPINPFDSVRSVGYAYGLHTVDDLKSIVVRGFQGHIVSRLRDFKRISVEESPFGVYELSFAAPRGLSGAPLLNISGSVVIYGVIIGNSVTKMLIFRSEERDSSSTIEQYEALTLGIAVTVPDIISLKSRILGISIGDYLDANGLLL